MMSEKEIKKVMEENERRIEYCHVKDCETCSDLADENRILLGILDWDNTKDFKEHV